MNALWHPDGGYWHEEQIVEIYIVFEDREQIFVPPPRTLDLKICLRVNDQQWFEGATPYWPRKPQFIISVEIYAPLQKLLQNNVKIQRKKVSQSGIFYNCLIFKTFQYILFPSTNLDTFREVWLKKSVDKTGRV